MGWGEGLGRSGRSAWARVQACSNLRSHAQARAPALDPLFTLDSRPRPLPRPKPSTQPKPKPSTQPKPKPSTQPKPKPSTPPKPKPSTPPKPQPTPLLSTPQSETVQLVV
jgi:hypothetical protein